MKRGAGNADPSLFGPEFLKRLLGQDVDRAGRPEADNVREADFRALDLAVARLAAEMESELSNVGHACGAERMAL